MDFTNQKETQAVTRPNGCRHDGTEEGGELRRNVARQVALDRFLESTTPVQTERLLANLINHHIKPILEAEIGRRSWDANERAQLISQVNLRVVQALRAMHAMRGGGKAVREIGNVRAWLAMFARQAHAEYLQDQYPEWSRLKRRIRRTILQSQSVLVWPGSNGKACCGLSKWFEQGAASMAAPNISTPGIADNEHAMEQALSRAHSKAAPLVVLIETALSFVGRPLAIDHLTSVIGGFYGLQRRVLSLEWDAFSVADNSLERLESRMSLLEVWQYAHLLTLAQRRALLLHSADENDVSLLVWLVEARIVSVDESARMVELPFHSLEAMRQRLPLSDEQIAAIDNRTAKSVRTERHRARNTVFARWRRQQTDCFFRASCN